ncbi:MAG TPA: hypothetical protein VIY48_14710, partial [Candidatus Paceibacterota bacterium]
MGAQHFSGPLFVGGRNVMAGNAAWAGIDLFVNTVHGSDSAYTKGLDWSNAFATMQAALDRLDTPKFFSAEQASNSRIWVAGCLKEHALAPLGVYGVQIIGAVHGRPRHSTSGGVVLDGNGASWYESATSTNKPLLELREQGWEVVNMLLVPKSGYGAVKLHREENATYPDASHFAMRSCKVISSGTRVGLGIDDSGASYHILVEDNEFYNLEYAYKASGVGIAAPGAHQWLRNKFSGCKHDIYGNFYGSDFIGNRFCTPYNGSTHPNTLNLAATADAGVATDANH